LVVVDNGAARKCKLHTQTHKTRTSSRVAAPGTCSSAIDDAFIVMPRDCSSSRESKYRSSPAVFGWMSPLDAIKWSLSVVLPWSTCARMHMLRMRSCFWVVVVVFEGK
jgi:hypothetical protein